MATYRIRVINSRFKASNEQVYPDLEAAKDAGTRAALEIGCEQVRRGEVFFGSEVRVEDHDQVVARFMVSMGVTPLQ